MPPLWPPIYNNSAICEWKELKNLFSVTKLNEPTYFTVSPKVLAALESSLNLFSKFFHDNYEQYYPLFASLCRYSKHFFLKKEVPKTKKLR